MHKYKVVLKDGRELVVEATRQRAVGPWVEFISDRCNPPKDDPQWCDVVLRVEAGEVKYICEVGKVEEKEPEIGIA